MALKKYKDQNYPNQAAQDRIKSGVESPESPGVEMEILKPLQRHPQMSGFYRAVDPDTGWMGWVEHTPEQPTQPEPTPRDQNRNDFFNALDILKTKKTYLDLGLITQEDYDAQKDQVIQKGKVANEL